MSKSTAKKPAAPAKKATAPTKKAAASHASSAKKPAPAPAKKSASPAHPPAHHPSKKPAAAPNMKKTAPGSTTPAKKPAGKPAPAATSSAKKPAASGKSAAPAASAKTAPSKTAPAKAASAAAPAAPPSTAPAAAAAAGPNGAKVPPKGITIVSNRPVRKPKQKTIEMPKSEPLIKPGMKFKPLITSGPKAPPSSGIPGQMAATEFKLDPKAKLPKKELDKYREILLRKRAELFGDVSNMEQEALRGGNSGALSNLPQHMAEQGSDAFDQALSLDLAQVDRNLIKEIDEALQRIEDGTFGVCLKTGKRITAERLAEVPWAKYSIEAAREMEHRRFTITPGSRGGGGGGGGGGDED